MPKGLGPKSTSYASIRKILRELPEYQIEKLIAFLKINGRQRELMVKSYIEHKTVQEIMDEMHIASTTTYAREHNKVLRKIELSINDIDIDRI